jgi:hypothetical protein
VCVVCYSVHEHLATIPPLSQLKADLAPEIKAYAATLTDAEEGEEEEDRPFDLTSDAVCLRYVCVCVCVSVCVCVCECVSVSV